MKQGKATRPPKQLIAAKVPVELRDALEKKAEQEDRSVSQVISRLLVSHPALKVKPAKQAA